MSRRAGVRALTLAGLVVLGLLSCGATAPASPQRAMIMPIAYGEQIFDAGPLPTELALMVALRGQGQGTLRAGYKCDALGLVWTWVARWGCQPVAYVGDSYYEDPAVAAAVAQAYPDEDAVEMGWWARHGRWALLGLLVAFVALRQLGGAQRIVGSDRNDGDGAFDDTDDSDDTPLDDPGGSIRRDD